MAGWIRSLTERSEGWAEPRSHPAYAVWPVVPAAPLDFRYRNPLTMTRSSRREPLKWGEGGREVEKLWQKPKCSRRQHIKEGKEREDLKEPYSLCLSGIEEVRVDGKTLRFHVNKLPRVESAKSLEGLTPLFETQIFPYIS